MLYKILIADDEMIECRALCHKLERQFAELLILPCVYNGIELLKSVEQYQPDIIIVDINMPGLNGLEAIELLKMKESHAKIIIHTAYSQFTYAKKAIELGAEAYVLKPDTDDEMVKVLTKLCADLNMEDQNEKKRQEEQREVDCLRDIVARKWILSLYQGEPDEECFQMLLKYCGILRQGGFLTAWKLETTEGKNLSAEKEAQNQLSTYVKELCSCVEFIHKGKLIYLIMPGEKRDDRGWIQGVVECIIQELDKQGIRAAAGVSSFKKAEEEFAEGIYEALMTLQDMETGSVSFFQSGKEQKKLLDFKSMQMSAQELSKGNIESCMAFAKEMFRIIEEDKKAAAFVYLLEMKESVMSAGDKNVEWEWRLWRNFNELQTEEELEQWLQGGLMLCYDGICGKDKENSAYIKKTYLFIDENYGRDISLENAAEAVGISYFYLSRMLKQEKNANFSEILTNVRIWRAIKKMGDSRKPIREISAEVGYSNVTYFYKVFKKTTGVSVGTMRKFL